MSALEVAVDIVPRIIHNSRIGDVVRLSKNKPCLKVFDTAPTSGSRGRRRTPLRWEDQVEKALAALDISNWPQAVKRWSMNDALLLTWL